jgi:branched-chain amino acid transport system ATP-binding protein
MLAIARALIGPTDLLMLDEPSEGLAPQIVESIFQTLLEIRQENTILLVEQNYQFARALADHYYILDQGRIVSEGLIDELDANDELKQQYLGVT